MSDQHDSPIKNWKQLVVVVVLAFVVPIALIVLLSQSSPAAPKGAEDDDSAVLARIKPVGDVELAVPSGPKGQLTGEQVYSQVCKTCHEGGLAGAPKVGDKAAWAKVIAQGAKLTVEHAIKGIRAMPAKGGNPDLENIEVERAVVFMANKAGAQLEGARRSRGRRRDSRARERTGEQVVAAACGKCHQTGEGGAPKIGDRAAWTPRVPSAARHGDAVRAQGPRRHAGARRHGRPVRRRGQARDRVHVQLRRSRKAAAPAPVVARRAAAAAAAPAGGKPDGKKIYDTACAACHAAGVAGAPKFGDKAAWAPRLKTGMDALYASALKGKAAMPAKGGNAALADADVKAAVDYMAAAAK